MPKISVTDYGDNQEILFTPAEGDLRIQNNCTLQKYYGGTWHYIGDLDDLFSAVTQLENKVSTTIEPFMWDRQQKDKEQIIADKLEEKFDDLQEAGTYLREMEKQLRVARKMYEAMTVECKEKLKTFERLDTPYPDGESGPGYSI